MPQNSVMIWLENVGLGLKSSIIDLLWLRQNVKGFDGQSIVEERHGGQTLAINRSILLTL